MEENIRCTNCGAENSPYSENCKECGQRLGLQQDTSRPMPRWPESEEEAQAERRRVMADRNTQSLVTIAFGLCVLGMFCCPLFALGGLTLGWIVRDRGHPYGKPIMYLAGAVFVIATTIAIIGFLVHSGEVTPNQ